MYRAFSQELIKVAAPKLSARALFEQQQSDKDFQDLLDSKKPGAVPKAFSKGFAAGLAIPAFVSANMFLSSKSSLADAQRGIRQLHIAEALKSFKLPNAHQTAAVLDRVVYSPLGTAKDIGRNIAGLQEARIQLDKHIASGSIPVDNPTAAKARYAAFTKDTSTLKGKSMPKDTMTDILKGFRQRHYTIQGDKVLTPIGNKLHATGFRHPNPIGTAQELQALEDRGRDLFKQRTGREGSVPARYAKNFGRYMARSSRVPLILGTIIGGMGVKGVYDRRAKLKQLQAAARKANKAKKAKK